MKSRTALIMLLTGGALLTPISAAHGASVLSDRTDASAAQYGPVVPCQTAPAAQTSTTTTGDGVTSVAPACPRAAATTSSLPFTGYAAIYVALAGLAVMLGGVIVRRVAARSAPRD